MKTFASFAQEIVPWNSAVLERKLAGIGRTPAHLVVHYLSAFCQYQK
jgi:hypothetical protein